MMIKFAFEKANSKILGEIWRPVARAIFTSPSDANIQQETWLLVDSGADYTLLPRYLGIDLKINFETDCQIFQTVGIGGPEKVFLFPRMEVQLGPFKRVIPVGFLDRNEVPPLLGRHLFMETLETYFSTGHTTYFSDKPFKSEE